MTSFVKRRQSYVPPKHVLHGQMLCRTCRFCGPATVATPDGRDMMRQCRIRAPRVAALGHDAKTLWPEVRGKDWCGEWEKLPDLA